MYNVFLITSMLIVVLSPLLLDLFLSLQEMGSSRHVRRGTKKSPDFAWASPRNR